MVKRWFRREQFELRAMATISYFELLLFVVVQVIICQIPQDRDFLETIMLQVFSAPPICDCPNLPSQMTCIGVSPQTLEPKPASTDSPLLPTGCSAACNITSLTVSDSNLTKLDNHWLHHLNLCPSSLLTIMVGGQMYTTSNFVVKMPLCSRTDTSSSS